MENRVNYKKNVYFPTESLVASFPSTPPLSWINPFQTVILCFRFQSCARCLTVASVDPGTCFWFTSGFQEGFPLRLVCIFGDDDAFPLGSWSVILSGATAPWVSQKQICLYWNIYWIQYQTNARVIKLPIEKCCPKVTKYKSIKSSPTND